MKQPIRLSSNEEQSARLVHDDQQLVSEDCPAMLAAGNSGLSVSACR